jgi:Tfp pilus assembly protein PilZ
MGDEWNYFYGYAKNISRSGVFIHTVKQKEVGDEFNIELTIPKTDITVKCRSKVVWNRSIASKGAHGLCMGLKFSDIEPSLASKIDNWVAMQLAL